MHTLLLGMTLIAHGYYMGDMFAKIYALWRSTRVELDKEAISWG